MPHDPHSGSVSEHVAHDSSSAEARGAACTSRTFPLTHISRRSFLTWVSASGAAVTARAHAAGQPSNRLPDDGASPTPAQDAPAAGAVPVQFTVNSQLVNMQIDPRTTLLDALRETLDLTGTKKGCDHGQCGACTVHVDGRRINACLSLALMNEGATITTIEGLGQPGRLHPMQQAFIDHDGYQCGYCTSGQIMSAVGLLNEPWGADDTDVKEAMSGNLCRCGAYKNIVAAIQQIRKG